MAVQQTTDEEFVRAHWERAFVPIIQPRFGCEVWIGEKEHAFSELHHMKGKNYIEAWAAAAEFTRERLERIRQLEEEIREVEFVSSRFLKDRRDCINRIRVRLESALADLKRGMKG